MKKLILSSIGFSSSILVMAQEKTNGNPAVSQTDVSQRIMGQGGQNLDLDIIMPVLVIGLLVYMTITVIKYFLEYRLKNKIIDRGVSEQLSASILENSGKSKYDEAMKFAILLCGIGLGLIITYYTLPLHIHSLAVMAFSIAASYLGYFFYLKNQSK